MTLVGMPVNAKSVPQGTC